MRDAKTLKASVTNWPTGQAGEPYQANIAIAAYQENAYEPQLLEALANHPGCKRLYYVPVSQANSFITQGNPINRNILKGERDRFTNQDFDKEKHVLAYDITDLLKRHDGEQPLDAFAIEKKIEDHIASGNSKPLSTRAINMYLSGHGAHWFDIFMPLHPNMFWGYST